MEQGQEFDAVAPTLFDQTKGRIGHYGKHRPGDVFTVINRRLKQEGGGVASKEQIQKVLESVPAIFPEDWKTPPVKLALSTYGLNEAQRELYKEVKGLGKRGITGTQIEGIILAGVSFRENSVRDNNSSENIY